MRRLYLQVYLTIVASLILVVITAGLLWHFGTTFRPFARQQFEVAGEIIAELVPPVDASPQAQQEAIERLAERIGTDLALFSRTNERLASAGRRLPAPGRSGQTGGWWHASRRGHARARSCSRRSLGPSRSWSRSAPVPW